MPLTTYAEARPWARAIKEEVLTRRMPKWHAARGYGDFVNDPSLSPFEIALVAAWADGGAPERTARGEGLSLETVRDEAETARGNATVRSTVTLPCGERSLTGHLLAVRPRLAEGASAGIAALLPDGRREIVAWIRNYEPDFPTTYWLRTPIEMRRGSRLLIQGDGSSDCSVTVTLGRE